MPNPQPKPKILLVTRNLPPLVGGMERMMRHVVDGLVDYAQVTVIGPKGCSAHLPAQVDVHEVSSKLAPFLLQSIFQATRVCRGNTIDLVIGGSGLLGPCLRLTAALFKVKTLVFLHGLDLVVNSKVYQALFVPSLCAIDSVIANSRNTARIAREKGISDTRIKVINPGTALPQLPTQQAMDEFRHRHGIHSDKILLFVGRLTKRKGLSGFIKHSLPTIFKSQPNTALIVVGDDPGDSLNKMGEQGEVQTLVEGLQDKDRARVRFLGQLEDSELLTCYAAANAQIFPLVDVPGDIEGFGMIAIEAAACGTPTVAFDLGGVSDAISPDNGQLVPAGHYDLFASATLDILKNNTPDSSDCLAHAGHFSWEIFNTSVHQNISKLIRTDG